MRRWASAAAQSRRQPRGLSRRAHRHRGGKGKVDVYDLTKLALIGSCKIDGVAYRLVAADTLRALLRDGRLVEQKPGDKKPRVIADFSALAEGIEAGVVGEDHVAFVRVIEDAEGNRVSSVVVDGVVFPLDGAHAGGVEIVGDVVYVSVLRAGDLDGGFARIADGRVSCTWLPRYPSGGSAPPVAEHAHQFFVDGGVGLMITWGDRGPCSRRVLRLSDLVEDARFGADFDSIHALGGSLWSSKGERVKDGARTAPIDAKCWSLIPLSDIEVVAAAADSKAKLALRRFRRYAG